MDVTTGQTYELDDYMPSWATALEADDMSHQVPAENLQLVSNLTDEDIYESTGSTREELIETYDSAIEILEDLIDYSEDSFSDDEEDEEVPRWLQDF